MKTTRKAALALGATALPLLTAFPASAAPESSVSFEIWTVSCPDTGISVASTSQVPGPGKRSAPRYLPHDQGSDAVLVLRRRKAAGVHPLWTDPQPQP
jgi:hypothetical protein